MQYPHRIKIKTSMAWVTALGLIVVVSPIVVELAIRIYGFAQLGFLILVDTGLGNPRFIAVIFAAFGALLTLGLEIVLLLQITQGLMMARIAGCEMEIDGKNGQIKRGSNEVYAFTTDALRMSRSGRFLRIKFARHRLFFDSPFWIYEPDAYKGFTNDFCARHAVGEC